MAKRKPKTKGTPPTRPVARPIQLSAIGAPAGPAPVPRQYAEPTFVPLQPGEYSDGDRDKYAQANKLDSQYGDLQKLPPRPVNAPDYMELADVLGPDAVQNITTAGQLVFHMAGDTGADKRYRVQNEADVASAMVKDLTIVTLSERPSFFYHLGDVVYEFGQAEDYYDQFYEPYCMYDAPIFAIPGNHDGMIWDQSQVSLEAFLNNFCTPVVENAENASSLHRTTMNQPGVYFTLETPFASVVGLYSNTSDKGTGVISTPDPVGLNSAVGQSQKNFLIREIQRLAANRNTGGNKAFILAVHHPPYKGTDNSVRAYCEDLDDAFNHGGLWPDLVLSGHEHNYARYTRLINGRQIPYVIAGNGGYNITGPDSDPNAKVPKALSANNPYLRAYVKAFGYLKVKVSNNKIAVVFNSTDPDYGYAADSVIVDLQTHQVTEGQKGVEPL